MRLSVKSLGQKADLPPGALVHVGRAAEEAPRLEEVRYGQDEAMVRRDLSPDDLGPPARRGQVTWVRLAGVHQPELVGRVGRHLGLSPLVMEDILNTHHRPKVEELADQVFVVVKDLGLDEAGGLTSRQVSLVLGRGWVASFTEAPEDEPDPVLARIQAGSGRIRRLGADYLAFALLDGVVDGYFLVAERLAERLEALEDALAEAWDQDLIHQLHSLRRLTLQFRRALWPLREAVGWLARGDSGLVSQEARPFFRDLYDHVIQSSEAAESLREQAAGLMELYLALSGERMNRIMKVLTVIATIFIPLTFVAGIYGMNFAWMPELNWRWGYPAVLAAMAVVALAMVWWFRRRRWL